MDMLRFSKLNDDLNNYILINNNIKLIEPDLIDNYLYFRRNSEFK